MKTYIPEVDSVMKEFLEKLVVMEKRNKTRFEKVLNEIAIVEKFVLNDISGLSRSFIETVLSTIEAVEQFSEIEPDGYSFHAEITDDTVVESQYVILDAYVTLFKFYHNSFPDSSLNSVSSGSSENSKIEQVEKLVEIDVFPGNEGHIVVCLYVPSFDTIEIDVTDTGYSLYILRDPYKDDWFIKENIVNRDMLFDDLYYVLNVFTECE